MEEIKRLLAIDISHIGRSHGSTRTVAEGGGLVILTAALLAVLCVLSLPLVYLSEFETLR